MANIFDQFDDENKDENLTPSQQAREDVQKKNIFDQFDVAPTPQPEPIKVEQPKPQLQIQPVQTQPQAQPISQPAATIPVSQDEKNLSTRLTEAFENFWESTKTVVDETKIALTNIPELFKGDDLKALDVENQLKTYEDARDKTIKEIETGRVEKQEVKNFLGMTAISFPERQQSTEEIDQRKKSLENINKEIEDLQKRVTTKREQPIQKYLIDTREEATQNVIQQKKVSQQYLDEKYGKSEEWSGQWIANNIAANSISTIGSLITGVAVTAVTKNPYAGIAAGFSTSFAGESSGAYLAAREAGLNDRDSQRIGVNTGLASALIEQIPLGNFLNKLPAGKKIKQNVMKRVFNRLTEMAKDGILEGTTETMQQVIQNAFAKEYDANRDLFEGTPEAFVFGAILGTGFSGVSSIFIKEDGTIDEEAANAPLTEDPDAPATTNKAIVDAVNTPNENRTQYQNELVAGLIEPEEVQAYQKKIEEETTMINEAANKITLTPEVKNVALSSQYVTEAPAQPEVVYRGVAGGKFGTGKAVLGRGLYTQTNPEAAAIYGEVRTLGSESLPQNPLAFNKKGDFPLWEMEVATAMGYTDLAKFRQDVPDIGIIVSKLGYDGVVVKFKDTTQYVKYSQSRADEATKVRQETKKAKLTPAQSQEIDFIRESLLSEDVTEAAAKEYFDSLNLPSDFKFNDIVDEVNAIRSEREAVSKVQEKELVKETNLELAKQNPLIADETVSQYRDVLNRGLKVARLSKGRADMAYVENRVAGFDAAVEALRNAGYKIDDIADVQSIYSKYMDAKELIQKSERKRQPVIEEEVQPELTGQAKREEVARRLQEKRGSIKFRTVGQSTDERIKNEVDPRYQKTKSLNTYKRFKRLNPDASYQMEIMSRVLPFNENTDAFVNKFNKLLRKITFDKDLTTAKAETLTQKEKQILSEVNNLFNEFNIIYTNKQETISDNFINPVQYRLSDRSIYSISPEDPTYTTKFLQKLPTNKPNVKRNEIEKLFADKEIKQVEKDLARIVLDNQFKDQNIINVQDFRKALLSEIPTIDIIELSEDADYSGINLVTYNTDKLVIDEDSEIRLLTLNTEFDHQIFDPQHDFRAGYDYFMENSEVSVAYGQFGHVRILVNKRTKTLTVLEMQSDIFQKSELFNKVINTKEMAENLSEYNKLRAAKDSYIKETETIEFDFKNTKNLRTDLEQDPAYILNFFKGVGSVNREMVIFWENTLTERTQDLQNLYDNSSNEDEFISSFKNLIDQNIYAFQDRLKLREKTLTGMENKLQELAGEANIQDVNANNPYIRFYQSYKNNYQERMVKEILRYAKAQGLNEVEFLTPLYLAQHQGFIANEDSEVQPYDIVMSEEDNPNYLYPNDVINYEGDDYIVAETTGDSINAFRKSKFTPYNESEFQDFYAQNSYPKFLEKTSPEILGGLELNTIQKFSIFPQIAQFISNYDKANKAESMIAVYENRNIYDENLVEMSLINNINFAKEKINEYNKVNELTLEELNNNKVFQPANIFYRTEDGNVRRKPYEQSGYAEAGYSQVFRDIMNDFITSNQNIPFTATDHVYTEDNLKNITFAARMKRLGFENDIRRFEREAVDQADFNNRRYKEYKEIKSETFYDKSIYELLPQKLKDLIDQKQQIQGNAVVHGYGNYIVTKFSQFVTNKYASDDYKMKLDDLNEVYRQYSYYSNLGNQMIYYPENKNFFREENIDYNFISQADERHLLPIASKYNYPAQVLLDFRNYLKNNPEVVANTPKDKFFTKLESFVIQTGNNLLDQYDNDKKTLLETLPMDKTENLSPEQVKELYTEFVKSTPAKVLSDYEFTKLGNWYRTESYTDEDTDEEMFVPISEYSDFQVFNQPLNYVKLGRPDSFSLDMIGRDSQRNVIDKYQKVYLPALKKNGENYQEFVRSNNGDFNVHKVTVENQDKKPFILWRLADNLRELGLNYDDNSVNAVLKANKKIFGDDRVKIMSQVLGNKDALGAYYEQIIYVLKGQANALDTFYHEAVHKYIDVFLTIDEQVALYEAAIEKYGTENIDFIEEKIAEDFIAYANERNNVLGKIRYFFDKVLERFNKYDNNKDEITKLYDDILTPYETRQRKKLEQKTGVPIGTGEFLQSTLGVKVERRAVEASIVTEVEKLPEYQRMNVKDQGALATSFLEQDPEAAISVALGKEQPPEGIIPESVFIAVENYAIQTGDAELIRQLATSPRVSEATSLVQRIRMLGERNAESPVAIITDITEARKAAIEKARGVSVEKETVKLQNAIKKEVSKIKKGDWESFINSIQC